MGDIAPMMLNVEVEWGSIDYIIQEIWLCMIGGSGPTE